MSIYFYAVLGYCSALGFSAVNMVQIPKESWRNFEPEKPQAEIVSLKTGWEGKWTTDAGR